MLRLNYNFRLRLQQSVVFMINVEWVSLELKALTNVRLWTGFGERVNSNECAVCSNRIELSNEKVRSHEMPHRTANIRLSKKPTKPPTFTSQWNKNRFKWRLLNLFGKCMYGCARILLGMPRISFAFRIKHSEAIKAVFGFSLFRIWTTARIFSLSFCSVVGDRNLVGWFRLWLMNLFNLRFAFITKIPVFHDFCLFA